MRRRTTRRIRMMMVIMMMIMMTRMLMIMIMVMMTNAMTAVMNTMLLHCFLVAIDDLGQAEDALITTERMAKLAMLEGGGERGR